MNLEGNSPIPEPARPMFEDCTVTSVDPLEIQRDCDESPIPFTPDTMIAPELLAVEDRVRVELAGERLIVVGRGNGFAVDSEATAGALVLRDASGRAQFADPSASADADTKGARDTAILVATRGQIPSSITVGSGSASAASSGLVTFTGCSSVALDGIFDGLGADTYDIIITSTGSALAVQYLRFRKAGATISSASYNRVAHLTYYGYGPTRSNLFGDTVLSYIVVAAGGAPIANARLTMFTPKKAGATAQVLTESIVAASDCYKWSEYGQGPGDNDGFILIAASGTMTGTIKVVKIG